jgi:addiction module HigA family antidote
MSPEINHRLGSTKAQLPPITPGELLRDEFLDPMGITPYRLAQEIGVSQTRISEILKGKRAITANTDLRLCRFFGLSNGYWLRVQMIHDLDHTQQEISTELDQIKPVQVSCA